jgi:hypothetical protein
MEGCHSGAHPEFFMGVGGADLLLIYQSFILKIILQKSCHNCHIKQLVTAFVYMNACKRVS